MNIIAATADGRYELLEHESNLYVRPVGYPPGSLGRWECSLAHFHNYRDVYRDQFPRCPASVVIPDA